APCNAEAVSSARPIEPIKSLETAILISLISLVTLWRSTRRGWIGRRFLIVLGSAGRVAQIDAGSFLGFGRRAFGRRRRLAASDRAQRESHYRYASKNRLAYKVHGHVLLNVSSP